MTQSRLNRSCFKKMKKSKEILLRKYRHCAYDVTFRSVSATLVDVEKQ